MSPSTILLLALTSVAAFDDGAYQYVYEYADNSVKMLVPKEQCFHTCEANFVVTYNAESELNPAAAAAGINAVLTALGFNGLVNVGPNAPTTHHATTHHTAHTAHSPHAVMPPPATPHNPSVHDMAMDVPMGMGMGGGTVIAPMPPASPVPAVPTAHEATMHGPMAAKYNKGTFQLNLFVSIILPCGQSIDLGQLTTNPEILAAVEAALSIDIVNIVSSEVECTDCSEVLADIADVCPPPGDADAETCQHVHSAILCHSPPETDTDAAGPGEAASTKVECPFDLSTAQGLEDYYDAAC